jgi:hypothetical protein
MHLLSSYFQKFLFSFVVEFVLGYFRVFLVHNVSFIFMIVYYAVLLGTFRRTFF